MLNDNSNTRLTGEYNPRKRKRTQNRMCSVFYVNLHLLAAIPNKDWVKKKNVITQKVDKLDKVFKCEKNHISPTS